MENPEIKPPIVENKPAAATDASLIQENQMLKGRLELRENQLKQAIDIANRANDEKKAVENKERMQLIDSIQQDSKFTKEDLSNKDINSLRIMRITLDRSMEKTFASIAADISEANAAKQPFLTVGAWDSANKKWTGGL
jgi:hypothetical protein